MGVNGLGIALSLLEALNAPTFPPLQTLTDPRTPSTNETTTECKDSSGIRWEVLGRAGWHALGMLPSQTYRFRFMDVMRHKKSCHSGSVDRCGMKRYYGFQRFSACIRQSGEARKQK